MLRESLLQHRHTASSLGSTSPMPLGTCRSHFTIGTSISLSGVHTNISTPVPAQSQEHSCTSVMRPTGNCRGSPAGSATIPTRGSDYISNLNLSRFRRLMAGRSAIRRFSRWRRCVPRLRSSTTQRHPRRPYLTLQYVSRSLAFCEDSGSASIVAQSITTASLRILALQGDCERMQLGGHQSARDCRIFLHEFSRCVFIGRLKNRNAKRLVA